MNFLNKIFRQNKEEEGIDKKAYEMGYKDGLKVGIRVGNKEGKRAGWKEAMSTIANLADEMITKQN